MPLGLNALIARGINAYSLRETFLPGPKRYFALLGTIAVSYALEHLLSWATSLLAQGTPSQVLVLIVSILLTTVVTFVTIRIVTHFAPTLQSDEAMRIRKARRLRGAHRDT